MASPSPGTHPSDHSVAEISRDEIRARLRDPAFRLVDVLPRASYEEIHLPGAVNLPLLEVESRAGAVLPDLAADIAVYCGGPT
jgi:rhodanese-related sulfurtransferase